MPIIERVMGKIGEGEFARDISEIQRFEKMLSDEDVLVLKYWFHLSKSQQRKRLKELAGDPKTRWRVTERDLEYFKLYKRFVKVSYLSGVGLIIILSQIPKLLGVPKGVPLKESLLTPSTWLWQGIAVGAVTIVVMAAAPKLTKAVPAAILGLAAGVLACWRTSALPWPTTRCSCSPETQTWSAPWAFPTRAFSRP